MIAQLFVFEKHIPEIEKFIKFGRDLYRHGVLIVFCDNWQVPSQYSKYVLQHLIINVPNIDRH